MNQGAMPAYPEWRPIESAPKDGTRVAVKFDSGYEDEANYQTTYGGEWHVKSYKYLPWHQQPTLWRPLPALSDQPTRQEDAQP